MANRKWTENSHLLLEQASGLENYNRWLMSQFKEHIGKNILEVGAGIGALSRLLPKSAKITLTDLREDYFSRLRTKFKCQVIKMDITEKLNPSLIGKFDTILSSNVFEHIKEDQLAFDNSFKLLHRGGKLLLFVPARPEIYGQLDDDMGHYRRYQISEGIRKARKSGFKIIDAHYANLPGYFTWWGRGVLLGKLIKSKPGNSSADTLMAKIFDVLITPFLALEKYIHPPFGQSLVLIAQKP